MVTKEFVKAEIDHLNERQLEEVHRLIKSFDAPSRKQPSLMAKLRRVEIDAPEDFSVNLDLYVSGEKRVE